MRNIPLIRTGASSGIGRERRRRERLRLAIEVEAVVEQHAADRQPDQPEVDDPRPVDRRMALFLAARQHMHGADGEARARSGMAAAAGGGDLVRVDVRARIGGRQDVVDAVAGGAVGHLDVARPPGETVEAVLERLDRGVLQAELLGDAQVAVAAPAGHLRDVRGVDRRALVAGPEDAVLAVAIGADRRLADPRRRRDAVDALAVGLGDLGMAGGAGRGDVLAVHLRLRVVGREGCRGCRGSRCRSRRARPGRRRRHARSPRRPRAAAPA